MSILTLSEPIWLLSAAARLVLSIVLGGLVGYEREHTHRPAGFRTHILVCLGSALVMVTAEYILRVQFPDITMDPTRLGAQVISGIGFLGAGTIIRNGSSVKGLTTAASLWAVACIGLASGSGFYLGAIFATLLTYVALISLKKLDKRLAKKRESKDLRILLSECGPDVTEILHISDQAGLQVRRFSLLPSEGDDAAAGKLVLQLHLDTMTPLQKNELMQAIHQLPSVNGVFDD